MPGLAVILGQRDGEALAPALDRMLASFSPAGCTVATSVHKNLGIAFGQAGPARSNGHGVGQACDGQIVAVLEGELTNAAALAARLGLAHDAAPASVAARLYAAGGPNGLEQLRGHWSVAILDLEHGRAVLANDTAGLRPLYRGRAADGAWVIASTPAAVLAQGRVSRAVDPAGLADTLAFSFALGARTLFQGIDCLPPASILTWDAGARELAQRQYWQLSTAATTPGTVDDLERVRRMFNEGVAEIVRLGGPITLALSGGMDSRAHPVRVAGLRRIFPDAHPQHRRGDRRAPERGPGRTGQRTASLLQGDGPGVAGAHGRGRADDGRTGCGR